MKPQRGRLNGRRKEDGTEENEEGKPRECRKTDKGLRKRKEGEAMMRE